jgi:hypothetical protein
MTEALKDTPKNTPKEKNNLCEKAFKSIYPSCGSKDTDLLESLKGILGNDIAERIKNFNSYKKPVLFISNNISLTRGAVAYLWYKQEQPSSPHVLQCSGLKEDEVLTLVKGDWIDATFTNIEFCTYLGGVLFFEDLNPYEDILKQLWLKAEDNKHTGIIVIGMDNIGNLSQGVLYRFEVIPLKTVKQGENTSKKIPRGQKQFYTNPDEFKEFLNSIIKVREGLSTLQLAKKAMAKMKTDKHFLDDNGNPLYKESTLKNKINKLSKGSKRTISSFSKLKNDGKVTVKKRYL